MANITIIGNTSGFDLYHNDLSSVTGFKEDIILKSNIQRLSQLANGHIYLMTKGGIVYQLSSDGLDGSYQVDLVNGVAPTNDNDLFEKIEALIV